jgi:putative ATPase
LSSNHLFDHFAPPRKEPLASRLRPNCLDEIIGQKHILGPNKLLRRAILADQISSLIFYGPPGTGKTTLAKVIAEHSRSHFITLNAVLAGVAQIRECIDEALSIYRLQQKKTILFVDEIHRFNKSQQDALLPHVENGTLILIGATTENPFFEVNKALVSRSRLFELKSLEDEDLLTLAKSALKDPRGYGDHNIAFSPEAIQFLVRSSNGDARTLLNAIELAVEPELMSNKAQSIFIDLSIAEESIQKRAVLYDRDGDYHYDIISAFIKSMRGSDPDAALFWLARMVLAGEAPHFIFRRMIIAASEDVGLANPMLLTQVMSCAQAFDFVGMPEGQYHLSQACLLICNSPKSNSTQGYFKALNEVTKSPVKNHEVPSHLKDPSRDGKHLGHGKDYLYPHDFEHHWVKQSYLPKGFEGKSFYSPSDQGMEARMQEFLKKIRHSE